MHLYHFLSRCSHIGCAQQTQSIRDDQCLQTSRTGFDRTSSRTGSLLNAVAPLRLLAESVHSSLASSAVRRHGRAVRLNIRAQPSTVHLLHQTFAAVLAHHLGTSRSIRNVARTAPWILGSSH